MAGSPEISSQDSSLGEEPVSPAVPPSEPQGPERRGPRSRPDLDSLAHLGDWLEQARQKSPEEIRQDELYQERFQRILGGKPRELGTTLPNTLPNNAGSPAEILRGLRERWQKIRC